MSTVKDSKVIPTFPDSTPIAIGHREEIEAITRRFPPYSDFNFTSLYVWNYDGSTKISRIGNNIVIQLLDYIDNKPVYSILGDDAVEDAVGILLNAAGQLKYVPEAVADKISQKLPLLVAEDPDNYDYVYNIESLAQPSRNRRKKIKRFISDTAGNIATASLREIDKDTEAALKAVFMEWAQEKQRPSEDTAAEFNALSRILDHFNDFGLVLSAFRVRGKLCGFSIDQPLSKEYAICHFAKSLNIHPYIYSFTDQFTASNLQKLGIKKINWEQDLGIAGLRTAKTNHGPDEVLKKYIIRQK